MGNCCKSCLGRLYGRRILRRYTALDSSVRERDEVSNYFSAELEELEATTLVIEDDEDGLLSSAPTSSHTQSAAVTENERLLLRSKNYSALIQSQRTFDDQIDKQLAEQEAKLRREEQVIIEEQRKRHQKQTNQQTNISKPANQETDAWPADNNQEWNVAGGEDDFDQFLDAVSRREKTDNDSEDEFVSAYTPNL